MAIPPVTLNLLRHLPSDDQVTFTDKLNFNWDQLSLAGGPPGLQGIPGIQGVPGSQGLQGFQGDEGTPGSKWYVQATTPALSPAPNPGDYWFNTSTLEVSEWDGSSWVVTGTLLVSSVFKESLADSDKIVFGSTFGGRSLVLSSIDLDNVAPIGGTYLLKLVGNTGAPLMKFAAVQTLAEEADSTQPYIMLDSAAVDYRFNIINPNGPNLFSGGGTSFEIIPVNAGLSEYEFNGDAFKVQLNAGDTNLAFAQTGPESGLKFHIGLGDALSTPASRAISVIDQAGLGGFHPRIEIRGAEPLASDATTYASGAFFDALHPQVEDITGYAQLWSRFRAKLGGNIGSYLATSISKTFNDGGNATNPERSVSMDLFGGKYDDGLNTDERWHTLSWRGGASSTGESTRPQFRITPPLSGSDNLWFIDVNGYMGTGNAAFADSFDSTTNPFQTSLNVQGPNSSVSQGFAAFAGMNFYLNNNALERVAGISASINGTSPNSTLAGLYFRKNTGSGIGLELGTGKITSGVGVLTRISIDQDGLVNVHGRNNSYPAVRDYKLSISADPGATVGTNSGLSYIYAYDSMANSGSGMYKDIILQHMTYTGTDASDANYHGGGFLGIGDMSSNLHQKPQTKLHVKGATTFGSRVAITSYGTNVGLNDNWTFGTNHANAALRGLILGGQDHALTNTATDSVIIGHSNYGSLALSTPKMVAVPTQLYAGHPDVAYINSDNPDFNNDNSVSIGIDHVNVGAVTNGLEVMYTYDGNFSLVQQAAAILVSTKDAAYSNSQTRFSVTGDGYASIKRDPISRTDPGVVSNIKWTDSSGDLTIGENTGAIVLGGTAGVFPTTSRSRITTGNVTLSSVSLITGAGLAVSPGITRNTNTAGTAVGGDLFLFGGRGEKNSGGTPVLDTTSDSTGYGTVYIGLDPFNTGESVPVKVFGRVSMFDNDPVVSTWTKTSGANQSGANSLVFTASNTTTNGYDVTQILFENNAYTNSTLSYAYFELDRTDYDRSLYLYNGGNYAIGSQATIEFSTDNTNWYLVGRWFDRPRSTDQIYYSGNVIVPAGTYLRLRVEGTESFGSGSPIYPDLAGPSTKYGITIVTVKFGNS